MILAAGRSWDAFSRENDWAEGSANTILGRSLFDMVAGSHVRDVATKVHAAVASGRRPSISYHYRCDAPHRKRQMRMAITCVECPGDALVLYQSQLLAATDRPPMALFAAPSPEAFRDTSRPIISMCSYCHTVAWPGGGAGREWIEPEVYYARGGTSDVRISHAICPRCYDEVVRDLD